MTYPKWMAVVIFAKDGKLLKQRCIEIPENHPIDALSELWKHLYDDPEREQVVKVTISCEGADNLKT